MALKVLVFMTIIDYITGILKAMYTKTLSSEIGYHGIIRKVTIFILVAVAFQLDCVLGTNNAIRFATIMFYIGNEGVSLLENAVAMDLPIPKQLKDVLSKAKKEGQDNE